MDLFSVVMDPDTKTGNVLAWSGRGGPIRPLPGLMAVEPEFVDHELRYPDATNNHFYRKDIVAACRRDGVFVVIFAPFR